jgi:hypothetical protein
MGGGGTRVEYQAPPVQRDDTFANYLKYQQERERAAEERAAKEKQEATAKEEARKAAGAAGYSGLRQGVESQLRQGLISYADATSQLRDYASKYDMTPPEQDVSDITKLYTQELLPGRRQTGISAAYEETLGRQATAEELTKAQERFSQGYYSTNQDLREALTKSPEYLDKYNQSYLDNYYDTQFGKQTTDEAGKKTGKRAFTFDKNLLPTYAESTKQRAGIVTPDFKDRFAGTPAEIEEQLQNVRETRKYLYSAGLTNLQGEIDKETQKLKNEGAKEVAKIGAQGNIYQQLVGAFSFS